MAANLQEPASRMSVEDYLATEPLSEVKREYLDGMVVAMAGASDRHGLICTALTIALGPLARKAGCQLFVADMKVRVQALRGTSFYYPDLVLSCDGQDRESPYYRRRPCLVIEVTSPSTERIDRLEKVFAYQQMPGLREYLIVDSANVAVDRYHRSGGEAGEEWDLNRSTFGSLRLDCLGADLSLAEVYADVPELAAAAASALTAEKSTSA
ncbi:MAG: Uma2 family endonuclease [Thiomonas sp.]